MIVTQITRGQIEDHFESLRMWAGEECDCRDYPTYSKVCKACRARTILADPDYQPETQHDLEDW